MDRSNSANTDGVLEVAGLAGGYGALNVFRELGFTLRDGEAIGITGVNGAGKTTLMNTIAGLLPPQEGTIKLLGAEVQGMPAYKRVAGGLVLVPEGRQIISALSVEDNLDLASAATRRSRDGASDGGRFGDVYSLFPRLRERAKQNAGSLSGGEQQMLAIGRAMLSRPRVLMLDEPTQGLAPVVVQGVVSALQTLRAAMPMVVVEQNRAVLSEVVDRIAVMRNGRLVFEH